MNNYSEIEIELINNIETEDMLDIIKKHENLSFDFIINYILNDKYQQTRKEKNITIETVVNYQPHLLSKFKKLLNNN